MNRIILIGNGFDLAHGIPSSYQDFMDDFWKNKSKEIQKTKPNKVYEDSDFRINGTIPLSWFSEFQYNTYTNLIESLQHHSCSLTYINEFLGFISNKISMQNWVDIENEYYFLLKKAYKDGSQYNISGLNSDLDKTRENLKTYLNNVKNNYTKNSGIDTIIRKIGSEIYSTFKFKDFIEDAINKKVKIEYSKIEKIIERIDVMPAVWNSLSIQQQRLVGYLDLNPRNIHAQSDILIEIRELLISEEAVNYFDLQPEQVLFLNFNYTNTETLYLNSKEFDIYSNNKNIETKCIHIHGSLDSTEKNPIIFGFGDEIDEDYRAIENLNDNRYLENIKSIKYLETDNYKNLLEFLNSENYQVFIFGHSCGISDRTLLNTVFEHENCVSIKPFYHRKNEIEDNFSDIIRNISRNFNNKATMRDKVVNKKFCEPLLS